MKIAVIGCGAMGCYFGAKLSQKNEVIFIDAFQQKVDMLNSYGITLDEDGKKQNYIAPSFLSGKYKHNVDLILLFVKSTQNMSALSENIDLISAHTIVVSLQNGYGNEREISRFVDKENILIGNTLINCITEEDGTIKKTSNGHIIIGSTVDNKKLALTGKLLFDQSSFETEISDNIKEVIWQMLFVNATICPLTALFGCKIKVCYENKNIWSLAEKLIQETVLVANEDGCSFRVDEVIEYVKNVCFSAGKSYTSMYQDVVKKRFTEIEKINGQIVNLAYKYNINAPYHEFVLNSVKAIEKLY